MKKISIHFRDILVLVLIISSNLTHSAYKRELVHTKSLLLEQPIFLTLLSISSKLGVL